MRSAPRVCGARSYSRTFEETGDQLAGLRELRVRLAHSPDGEVTKA